MRVVGRPIPHESAREHVTGRALYTDDLVNRYPNVLHSWPVASPHARARVRSVDSHAAREVPGVACVLTAGDVPGMNDTGAARHDEPLFPSEALYHGHPVAWVLAESEEAARLGAQAVRVDYEPLPAILTIEEAIERQSFHTDLLRLSRGEPKKALREAPHRLGGELYIGGQEHFYLESQAALACLDEAGHVLVHSSTQHPSETQDIVARVLGIARNQVIVQSLRMGGAFGGKEVQANPWAAVAALGAWKTGRPVRVRLGREADMVMTGKRHPFLGRFSVGFDNQGKLLALQLDLYSDGGYSLDLSEPVLFRAMFHADNAYLILNAEVTGRVVMTHKSSNTAFRGFGGPQGMVMIEDIVDRIARHLGIPPHEVRERNFYQEGDTTHYGQAVKDASRIHRIWDELKKSSGFEERRLEVARSNASGARPGKKRGIAITPVKFGISFTASFFNQAGALVLIYQDGSVQVNHGGTEMGQGLHTKIMQVAAEALGVPLSSVRIMPTRTDKVPNTSATAASSGADLNGAAVRIACDALRERLAQVAGRLIGYMPEDLVFSEGRIFAPAAPEHAVTFAEIVRQAYQERVPLFATGYYRTPNLYFDRATGQGKPFHYYAYGASVSEVEVDEFTGEYRVVRVDILHDVGDSLSPLVDKGQVEGGFVQGMGWVTLEELAWDASGRLATRGASTYKLPSAGDIPEEFNVRLLERATEPSVVHGSKAVGEPPFMLAFSVREALREAIAAVGTGGIVELPLPSTPESVYWAIERHRGRLGDRVPK
ncbi:MAG: xanthine dehydrogenase molybdopterin binding subunit [Deltaproteobacteria bacterium]|nr:xanthine dehydrogenase molybdopterin binding subunit [Deltaproteobacteria bacterium]